MLLFPSSADANANKSTQTPSKLLDQYWSCRTGFPTSLYAGTATLGRGLSATSKSAPVRALPYELLAAIFECYQSFGGLIDTLLLVSKIWNSFVFEHKSLWKTLELSLFVVRLESCPDDSTFGTIATTLHAYSRGANQEPHSDDAQWRQRAALAAAFEDVTGPNGCNVRQWRSLRLYECTQVLHLLIVYPTPIRESLTITNPWQRASARTPLDQVSPYAPRLQYLYLSQFGEELALPPCFLRVRSFTIGTSAGHAYSVRRHFQRHKHSVLSLEYVVQE